MSVVSVVASRKWKSESCKKQSRWFFSLNLIHRSLKFTKFNENLGFTALVLILIALDSIYTQLNAKQHQEFAVWRQWKKIHTGAQRWWWLGDLFQCSIQLLLEYLMPISERNVQNLFSGKIDKNERLITCRFWQFFLELFCSRRLRVNHVTWK